MFMASVRLSTPLAICRVKNQSDVEICQNRDTVQSMIDNGVNTMVVANCCYGYHGDVNGMGHFPSCGEVLSGEEGGNVAGQSRFGSMSACISS